LATKKNVIYFCFNANFLLSYPRAPGADPLVTPLDDDLYVDD